MISLANQNGSQDSSKWYILRTEPQADSLAASELRGAGFEVFFPRINSRADKGVPIFVPLFPGYLFLKWDMEGAGKPSLHRAPHVSGWVNFEGVAPEVSEEVVCELAGRVENINEAGGMWRTFKAGDKVRVLSGKFESLGEVIDPGTSANHKVRILMEFMGRLISAQVPWSNLQPLESIANEKLRAPRRTRGHGRWIRNSEPALIGSS